MDNYIKVKNILESNDCSLLTSFEEFEKKRENVLKKSYQYVRIEFIGICSHNSSATFTNFKCRQTGIRCKNCVISNTKKALKSNAKETNNIEYNSIKIIEPYLLEKYHIIRTKEACKADLVISKKETKKYIPIQVKSTVQLSRHKMYSFRCINKYYDNMIMICVCISEKKIWIIPYEDIKQIRTLNISLCSKYNKYLLLDNNLLCDEIDKYAEKYYTDDLTKLITPITILQQREQNYVRKRETIINFLDFSYPNIQNTFTDFIVNNKKIQEKVTGLSKYKGTQSIIVHLASNNGKNDKGFRNFRTYRLGENDYYWFHSSIDDRFWIIPENILYEKGYISNTNETLNKKVIYIGQNTEWIKEYQYDYNNINKDKDKIKELFK